MKTIITIELLKKIYSTTFNKDNNINIELDVLTLLSDCINKLIKKLENKGPEEIIWTYRELKGKSFSGIIDLFETWYKKGIINEFILEIYESIPNIYISIFIYIFLKKLLEEIENEWEILEEENYCINKEDIDNILSKDYKVFKKYL